MATARNWILLGAVAFALALALPSSARADVYHFVNISSNSVADAATGEAQLTVDVRELLGF